MLDGSGAGRFFSCGLKSFFCPLTASLTLAGYKRGICAGVENLRHFGQHFGGPRVLNIGGRINNTAMSWLSEGMYRPFSDHCSRSVEANIRRCSPIPVSAEEALAARRVSTPRRACLIWRFASLGINWVFHAKLRSLEARKSGIAPLSTLGIAATASSLSCVVYFHSD